MSPKSKSKRKSAATSVVVQSTSTKIRKTTAVLKSPESNDFAGWKTKCDELLKEPIGFTSLENFRKLSTRLISAACSSGNKNSFLPLEVASITLDYYESEFPMVDLMREACGVGTPLASYCTFLAERYSEGEFRADELKAVYESRQSWSVQGHEVEPILTEVLVGDTADESGRAFLVALVPLMFREQKYRLYAYLMDIDAHATIKLICDSVKSNPNREAFSHVGAIESTLLDPHSHLWDEDTSTSRARLFMSWFHLSGTYSRMPPELARGLRATHDEWILSNIGEIWDQATQHNLADLLVDLYESGIPEFTGMIDPEDPMAMDDEATEKQITLWSTIGKLVKSPQIAATIEIRVNERAARIAVQDA